jgi:aromatic ring-opening dioxygenase catalytic subunit (LigB family)
MAQLIGGVGVPHTPHFPGIVDRAEPLAAEIGELYGRAANWLWQARPDVLVFFTCDHYYNFFVESIPIFAIGVAESARGPGDYRELRQYEVRVHAPLARRVQAHLVQAGFDVGMSQEFELDHPVTVPLHFLTPGMGVPIVPVFINGLIPPLAPAWRCHALGTAIGAALAGEPDEPGGPLRVAAIASGSFSLEIGGPRISAHSHTGVPDLDWFDHVLVRLGAGEVGELVKEATGEQLARAGNAGGELLSWIAMLGLLDPGPPEFLAAQRDFGHAFGIWGSG